MATRNQFYDGFDLDQCQYGAALKFRDVPDKRLLLKLLSIKIVNYKISEPSLCNENISINSFNSIVTSNHPCNCSIYLELTHTWMIISLRNFHLTINYLVKASKAVRQPNEIWFYEHQIQKMKVRSHCHQFTCPCLSDIKENYKKLKRMHKECCKENIKWGHSALYYNFTLRINKKLHNWYSKTIIR